ncbi:MAG: VanZ family protein [Gammaproteobacteria bacterium]
MNRPFRSNDTRSSWRWALLLLSLWSYLALLIAGSLYPATAWRVPGEHFLAFLIASWPRYATRTDITTNILVYLPFGFLLASVLRTRMRLRYAVWWVATAGLLLSLLMEILQNFLPGRNPSNLDVLTNTAGAFAGAFVARVTEGHRWPGSLLFAWRKRWFLPGWWVNLGIALLGLWALSQLSLQTPSLVAGNLHTGFTPFWEAPPDISRIQFQKILIFMLEIAGLGLFTATLISPRHRMMPVSVALFTAAVLFKFFAAAIFLKLPVLARLISVEALAGLGMGLILLLVIQHRSKKQPCGAALAVLISFVAVQLIDAIIVQPGGIALPAWPLIRGNPLNVTGLASLMAQVWPVLAITHLLMGRLLFPAR